MLIHAVDPVDKANLPHSYRRPSRQGKMILFHIIDTVDELPLKILLRRQRRQCKITITFLKSNKISLA